MKKILFVHNKLVCGGAESALYDLVRLLDKSKYDITVLVLHDGGEWEQKFKEAGIKVINSYNKLVQGKHIHNFILRKRIEYSRKNHGRNLISLCTNENYDLIIAYHIIGYFKDVVNLVKTKTIHYIHGDVQTNLVLKNLFDLEKNILSKYNRFISVSNLAKKSFNKIYGLDNKVSVVFNPIDDQNIKNLSNKDIMEYLPSRYICAVGRLSGEKGFDRLIKIHKLIIDNGIKNNLVIVGDGPERENLEAIIKELGVENSVYLVGYKINPYPYIKNSLFTVISSYTEGLPVTSMESICLGVPVVSSFPTVGELFADECCGIVTENDDESLKLGIEKMLLDKEFYKKTLEGAKVRSKEFTSEKMIEKVEQVFDSVLKENSNDT